jgi:hypothetical protein
MRRLFVLGVCVLAVFAASSARATSYNTADENHIEAMVNQTRAGVGVKALAHQSGLQGMARAQAVRMAERGDIYHNPNLSADITALGVNWKMVGENVGMGPDADTVYAALLKSPHHYENITRSNYTSIGVGEVTGPGPRVYLVQVFAEIVPATAKKAPTRTVAPLRHVVTVAPARHTSTPRPATIVHRPDPNALFGGLVFQASLPRPQRGATQARHGAVRRLVHDLYAWV